MFGDFDADGSFEVLGGGEAEESAAAVGVDEMLCPCFTSLGADVFGEAFEDERVVLKEFTCGE